MQVGLRHFDAETLDWFAGALRAGELTRHALARELCQRINWRNALGEICHSAAATALPQLAAHVGLELPPVREGPDPTRTTLVPPGEIPDTHLSCSLEQLGLVTLEPVGDRADRHRWEAMIDTHHELGWNRSPGGQMRYWVRSARHGVLGGIGFGSATFQLKARDDWIGWSNDARAENISRVLCNHRFLVLPGVRVPGLASQVLRLARARVADDWDARYAVRPVAVYTHVAAHQSGYCYQCAGWTVAGRTSGRRAGSGTPGTVRVLPLEAGWQEILCQQQHRPIGSQVGLYDGADVDWAQRQYGRCRHPDGRVRRRIVEMGRHWMRTLGEDLTMIFPTRAAQKAAYRLVSNRGVTMEHILDAHYEATADRCRTAEVALMLQDTTVLNYSTLKATEGLVPIGGGGTGSRGLLAHAGLAVTPQGLPLGLFSMETRFRDEPDSAGTTGTRQAHTTESHRWIAGLRRAREVAAVCPDTRVVTVCDREGDFWALLAEADRQGDALLVRASRSTRRQVLTATGDRACLWAQVAATPAVAITELTIPAAGGTRARRDRTARLEIRATPVQLAPPDESAGSDPLPLYAVSATETDAPEGTDPLHWLLVTTEHPAQDEPVAMHAATLLDWYRCRWAIETWFRTLKTGPRIGDRRLNHGDDLRTCLACDAVTAVQCANLTMMAREHPETPATEVLPAEDIDLLHTLLRSQGHPMVEARSASTTIRAVVIDIGRLVGAHPSARQPLPGTKKVWQGLERLNWAVQVRDALGEKQQEERLRPGPSEHPVTGHRTDDWTTCSGVLTTPRPAGWLWIPASPPQEPVQLLNRALNRADTPLSSTDAEAQWMSGGCCLKSHIQE